MLAGEMEVDGDLNVSGNIQSPTIAQLQEIIAQLQAQIVALQNGGSIQSKIYQLTFEGEHNEFIPSQSLSEITGAINDWYAVTVLNYNYETISGTSSYAGYLSHYDEGISFEKKYSYGHCGITTGNGGRWEIDSGCQTIFSGDSHPYIYYTHNGWDGNVARTTLTVLITTDYSQ